MSSFVRPPSYAPYESDSESDTDSGSDLDTGEDNRKETTKEVQFGFPPDTLTYVPYAPPKYELKKPTITKSPDTTTSQVTSVVVINSKDRDRTAYPTPTFFTLRLPRIYRNIKSINLTEISILNSFFNFRASKGNTTLPLTESGRSTFTVSIREGTYTSDSLVSELQSALNKTPLFANISFTNFKNQFKNNGDFSILFNEPNGEIFNYQTNQYDSATNVSQIVAQYFQQQETFGISNFTNDQCAVAFYYPCMKQMILQKSSFNLYPAYYNTLQPESTLYPNPADYILFGFQGLSDRYITFLAKDPANLLLYQTFHDANTFLNFPVNQYTCIYNSQNGRFQITAPNINTSISTDIANQYNTILNQLAYNYGYDGVGGLNINLNSNSLLKQVRFEFYNFIQKQFVDLFGINFGTYTSDFFVNPNNEIILYNTKNKVGWITNSNFIPDVLISTFPYKLPDVPVYWPNLQFRNSTITDGVSTILFYSTLGLSNNLDANGYLQFSNASEHQTGYFDLPFDILPTTYARMMFQSKMRQTIELMTIPRYLDNRSTLTNEVYKFGSTFSETPFLFSTNGLVLIDPYTNTNYSMYSIDHVLFKTPDYMRFAGTEWLGYVRQVEPIQIPTAPSINDIKITSFQPYILFQINAAEMVVMPNGTFNIDIYVETQDENPFPVPINLTWYRDRSAFMADVNELYSGNNIQNPYYYFVNETFEGTNSASITCKTLSQEISYLMVHVTDATSLPTNLPLRVFAVNTDLLSITSVTPALPLDYRKLPYDMDAIELVTPMNAEFQDPLTSIFSTATDFFQLGYSSTDSNISNNLLDWMIQGTNQTHYDPNSIEIFSTNTFNGLRYVFQDPNGGSATPNPETTSWSLFFPTGTCNAITDTYTTTQYDTSSFTITNGSNNEFTLTNWFNSATAKESFWKPLPYGDSNYLMDCSTIQGGVSIFQACINPSFNLFTDISTNSGAYDSNGLTGLSFFLPPGEVVSMQEVVLKFGYTAPTFTDPTALTPVTRNGTYKQVQNYVGSPTWLETTTSLVGDTQASGYNVKMASILDSSGNMIVAYSTNGTITGGSKTGIIDIVLLKLDPNGSLIWSRQSNTFNSIHNNIYPQLAIASDGTICLSFFIVDATYAPILIQTLKLVTFLPNGTVQNSITIANADPALRMVWQTFKLDSNDDWVIVVQSNYYLTSPTTGTIQLYKYDMNLDPVGSFAPPTLDLYAGLVFEWNYMDLCVDSQDEILLAHSTYIPISGASTTGSTDIVVRKFNSNGTLVWAKQDNTINRPGINFNPSITSDSNNNIYVGFTIHNPSLVCNAFFKLTSSGTLVWFKNDSTVSSPDLFASPDPFTDSYDTEIMLRIRPDNTLVAVFSTNKIFNNGTPYAGAQGNVTILVLNTDGLPIWANQNQNINVPATELFTLPTVCFDSDNNIYCAYQPYFVAGSYVVMFRLAGTFNPDVSLAVPNSFYTVQSCDPDAQTEFASWDDWYLPNRQNLRIGVYPTAQISSIAIESLVIESSICTLSLNKITQINNFTYTTNSVRRRQPEWGTYYTYRVNPTDRILWAPTTTTMTATSADWTSTIVGADLVPTYYSCMTSNEGYFETAPTINNYNGLERNYGLAPAVGFTVATPYSTISNWVSDIPNSYTMVPFYWDGIKWNVGSWYGLTFTTVPQLPSASTLGASPYYGPPGMMGWTSQFSSLSSFFTLASTGMTTFNPVYWNAKVTFNQLNDGYEPRDDLTAFGGGTGISGELQDTRMFFYQNVSTAKDLADLYIPSNNLYVYAAEKAINYTARDDNSGYNYLSYLPNLTVRSTLNTSTCEYAVHVRGQVPTVQFTTGLRVMGKNYTDFGTVQLKELITEISSLSGYIPIGPTAAYSFVTSNTATINQSTYTYQNLIDTNNSIRYNSSLGHYFSFDYADSLITFDRQFSVGTATYGVNASQAYPGITFSFYNFSTALSSYIGFYDATFTNFSTIIGIYAEANLELQSYISTAYNGILPPQFITRSRYTDPLTFALPFSTSLVTPYTTAVDEWGLGWNLGFAKKDTPYAVSQTSQTFIRIVADYLYLRLNESYNMNGISVTEPENLSLTRDSMGQNQRYFAKILLNDFGSISRTAVQMPKEFSPATNKFDTFSFELVDKLGQPIVNSDCDSDLTLQIVEERTDLKIDTHPAQNIIR